MLKMLKTYRKVSIIGLVLSCVLFSGANILLAEHVSIFQPAAPLPDLSPREDLAFGAPQRISIPSLEVNAPVIPVGLTASGAMGVPENEHDVAWYKGGPNPGMPGSAVMAGHLNTKITPSAVFYRLKELQRGDRVEVTDTEGATAQFEVVSTSTYAYNASVPEVFFAPDGSRRLSLITCAGNWILEKKVYSHRLVVFAKLVE